MISINYRYSSCKSFKNETIVDLEEEVIKVSCSVHSGKKDRVIYEDAYVIIKKLNIPRYERVNNNMPWNMMLVGMDTMSRARVYDTMPHTVKYLRNNNWLDFRGYQKVSITNFKSDNYYHCNVNFYVNW